MRKPLVALASLGVSLLAIETILRVGGAVDYRPLPPKPDTEAEGRLPHRAGSIPGLAYELVPDAVREWRGTEVRTNSYGMRDREPLAEADGLFRIAVLGDSFTFGWMVEQEDAYPDVLERLLEERSDGCVRFDVLNFGVVGYSTRDEAIVLEHKARDFEPDLVVIGYVLNDPAITPLSPLHAMYSPVEWWQHSALLRLGAKVLRNREVRRLGGGDYNRFLHTDERRWKGVVDAFESIRATTDELGAKVLLAIFPMIPRSDSTWDPYPYADINAKVAALGRENGFDVLDLLPVFAEHSPSAVSIKDRHPNELGQRLAAEALCRRIMQDYLGEPIASGK